MATIIMELEEGKSSTLTPNLELKQLFSEFLATVVKFEELGSLGEKHLNKFRQSLQFLRRPSISDNSSKLLQTVIKANETLRFKSYLNVGCVNVHDSRQMIIQLSTSSCGLREHLIEAEGVIEGLKKLTEKACAAMQMQQIVGEDDSGELESFGAENRVSFMAVICAMLKEDYAMQERIILDLNLKTSTGKLDGYCLMWSLRPFVVDDVIHQALKLIT